MNKEEKNVENEEQQWEKHLRAVEVARGVVREEAYAWRLDLGLDDDTTTPSALAMEMQLFAMSLPAPLSAGGIDTVEFFCEQTGVDFSHIMELMNNAISYGRAVVESEDGH